VKELIGSEGVNRIRKKISADTTSNTGMKKRSLLRIY
jgi:hypothetical protein